MPLASTPTRQAARSQTAEQGLPTPVAGRLQRPSWRDGRLVGGVLLVLLAMVAGALTLRHFDSSVSVLQASRTLEPGDQLQAGDVTAVDVRLDAASRYLATVPTDSRGRVLREIRAGELVPRSAVGDSGSLPVRTIAVPVSSLSSMSLQRGAVVDVWVSPRRADATGATTYDAPARTLERVSVASVPSNESGLASAAGDGAVQIVVPQERVSQLLGAMNSGGKVDLVPVSAGPPT